MKKYVIVCALISGIAALGLPAAARADDQAPVGSTCSCHGHKGHHKGHHRGAETEPNA